KLVGGQALDPSQSQRCRGLIQSLEQSPHFSTNPTLLQMCAQTRHWLATTESQLLNSMQSSLSPGSSLLKSSSGSGERPSLDIGEKIDRYTILGKLGQGGMGAVFLCFDEVADRKVAIKVLLEIKNEKHVSAMLDEAKAAASLTHRNCVGIHDLKRETNIGSPAIVLEYVPGVDGAGFLNHEIFERCDGHFLTPLSALLILEQMVAGLRAAHQLGMVHQDIKPENFLFEQTVLDQLIDEEDEIGVLTPEAIEDILLQNRQRPWVKLSDLGMALSKERKNSDLDLSLSVSFGLSQIPEYKRGGTYVYMPPEQMDGVGISRVTDVFALGLVFYTLLTGLDARIARKHAEDLEDFHYESVQTFLVAIASSKADSAISAKKDPVLRKLGLSSELLALLEEMSARDKTKRVGSSELATRVEDLIEIEFEGAASGKQILALIGIGLLFLIPALILFFGDWSTKAGGKKDLTKSNPSFPSYTQTPPAVKEFKSNEDIWKEIRSNEIDSYGDMTATSPGIMARIIEQSPKKLIFNRLEVLSSDDALALAHFAGDVELKKTTRLSDEVLEILAFSRAYIQLDSRYKTIYEDLRKKANLVQSEAKLGKPDALKQLKILQVDIAQSLYELGMRELRLPALLILTPKAAKLLKYIPWRIELNGLSTLSRSTGLALAEAKAKYLALNGLESLDKESARALAGYKGHLLYLNGLKLLAPEVAEALSNTPAQLRLYGLTEMSPEVARGFANHSGVLSLGGLPELDVELAKA
ncbi:MAG: serine/threonine-protein kinase, partial [Planctomycetota bacterium]|nr:serine/threonine-protein kinase [Planctomycetota bacterium]